MCLLLYGFLYGQKFMMCYDEHWIKLLFCDRCTMLDGDHSYGFASSMGHPRSNSVGQLVYDDMRTYPGHRCCITSLS
jgi:hypothetical protein